VRYRINILINLIIMKFSRKIIPIAFVFFCFFNSATSGWSLEWNLNEMIAAAGSPSSEFYGERLIDEINEITASNEETKKIHSEPPSAKSSQDWATFEIDTVNSHLRVKFGNSLWDATIRVNSGGTCGQEHAIRDWVIKPQNVNNVSLFIDACAQRGPLSNVELIHQNPQELKMKLEYNLCSSSTVGHRMEYTIYPDSSVIKVNYLLYSSWTNQVDIGTPGGKSSGTTALFGQDHFISNLQFLEHSYWNIHDGDEYANDPKDGGCLNYGGYFIMVVCDPATGIGFGRIMPLRKTGQGGINIIKLLWSRGFETFSSTGFLSRPSFTSFLYLFDQGIQQAIETGKSIVRAHTGLTNITECSSNTPGLSHFNNNLANLKLYPNPASRYLEADISLNEASNLKFEMIDLTGRTRLSVSEKSYPSGYNRERIDVRHLPQGIYLFRITFNNDQISIRRVMITRE
jgi:hypothetical protein